MEQSESIAAPLTASVRAWTARVFAASASALALLALSAAVAAAAEPLEPVPENPVGSLIVTVDAVAAPVLDPVNEPLAPIVDPVTEPLAPIHEPPQPVVPTLPGVPAVPNFPGLRTSPTLPALPTLVDRLIPDLVGLSAPALREASAPTFPAPIDALPVVAAGPAEGVTLSTAASVAAVADDLLAAAGDLAAALDVAITGAFGADGGTTVMAGTLIAFLMAMAGGWSSIAGGVRLRPIGLRLAPPVPPG